MALAVFEVVEIPKLPVEKINGIWQIADTKLGEFWKAHAAIDKRVGCYIFSIAGKGGKTTPWYVGKAGKSFRQEVFHSDKQLKYNKILLRHSGRPCMFLLPMVQRKGPKNQKAITKLEKFLISFGFDSNPYLSNKRGKPVQDFEIKGVLPARRGEAKRVAAKNLRNAMNL